MKVVLLKADKKRPVMIDTEGPDTALNVLKNVEKILNTEKLKIWFASRLDGDIADRQGRYTVLADRNAQEKDSQAQPNVLASACLNFEEEVYGDAVVYSFKENEDGWEIICEEDTQPAFDQINGYADILMLIDAGVIS